MTWGTSPYVFDIDEQDQQASEAWFLDGVHGVPAPDPMSGALIAKFVTHGFIWGVEKISCPTINGWLWRTPGNGPLYIAPLPITSEDERKQREPRFRQAVVPIIEDYDRVWGEFKSELMDLYKPLKEFDVEKASNIDLLDAFLEAQRAYRRMCEIHFYMMYGLYGMWLLLEQVCKELFGIDDTNPDFQKLMSGFDNKIFEGDKWLWQLSQRATELGLGDLLRSMSATELASKLNESDAGKKWLGELGEYLEEFGWKNQRCWHLCTKSWREDPSLAIERVQGFMATPEFSLPETRKALAAERERVAKEFSSRVPEEQRGWFSALLSGAQHSGSWSEEHNYYCEFYNDSVMRRIVLEWGRRLVAAGTIEQRDDIFCFGPLELEKIALAAERYDLRALMRGRRTEWEENKKKEYPPVISKMSPEQAFGWLMQLSEPVNTKVIVGTLPTPKAELKADLFGVCGAHGTVEGIARVAMSDTQLSEIQPGEILIAPFTTISWTPVFALISGIVVDRGGSLSHAAIVSREYGIPCVLNTFRGTAVIKTGQRIRVDADTGAIYIIG